MAPHRDEAGPARTNVVRHPLDPLSGEEIRHEPVVRPKGHWQKPLTETELREKFLDCAEGRLGRKQAEALFAKLNKLEDVASLRELPVVAL